MLQENQEEDSPAAYLAAEVEATDRLIADFNAHADAFEAMEVRPSKSHAACLIMIGDQHLSRPQCELSTLSPTSYCAYIQRGRKESSPVCSPI